MPLLTPYDLLVPSGSPVRLEIEVEDPILPFIDPPRRGFRVTAASAAGLTGEDGFATVDLGPMPDGLHRIPVGCEGAASEARVLVLPREAPVVITDIDETISASSPYGFILKPVGWVRPLPGAREALAEIAARRPLMYLTARDHVYTAKTRRWLEMKGFPDAPVYLRQRTRYTTVRARHHKIARLARLKQDFPAIAWGVGDKAGDVEAYVSAGIRPILYGRSRPPGVPEGVPCTTDWDEIRRLILG